MGKNELHPVISVRLFKNEKCFGPGINELLKRVEEHKSLRSAANSMQMAYSKAWRIVKDSEQALGVKLLRSTTGGVGGGGAALTPEASKLVEAYQNYLVALNSAANTLFEETFEEFLK
ncbi:LysR family transcriptional regulator [Eubacteriales bacterium OttesenSCG-928-K08]|nr:LysR family transcriptional regulator [Eubacteriales bacterium OttesenSCG-928-K08]